MPRSKKPMRLSEMFVLYNPPLNEANLRADLKMFSDPENYVQDDPMLQARKEQILFLLGEAGPREVNPQAEEPSPETEQSGPETETSTTGVPSTPTGRVR
jgi:hypothetical protein